MTRVDFYASSEPRLHAACRLVASEHRKNRCVMVYAPEESAARAFDKLLWTYQAIGFVPHCMAHDVLASETPVVITGDPENAPHHQVILNLHSDSAPAFSRFERLIELVGNVESERALARHRYRFYRDRGYEIGYHELPPSAS